MKKQLTKERAITLIALIITIVVLLILAAVAINSIQNDGLIQYAQNATSTWNQVEENEVDTLISYEDFLKYQSCTGHSYVDGVCTKCGYKPCEKEHKYGEWTTIIEGDCGKAGSRERTCSVCGTKETETVTYEHENTKIIYTELSETGHSKNEVCTKCNTVLNSVEEQHEYGEWTTVKEADCSTETNGSEERVCRCGNKEIQTVEYAHKMGVETLPGYTNHVTRKYCTACYYIESETEEEHNWEDYVVDNRLSGKICSICNYVCDHDSNFTGEPGYFVYSEKSKCEVAYYCRECDYQYEYFER